MHFSSSVVYGARDEDNGLVNEDYLGTVDMLSDRCSYDEGKRFAESMVKTYKDVYGLDAKIVRVFRIYGPRMALDRGNMLPDFISHALDNTDITIYGTKDFSSSFCYISDCIDGVRRLMDSDIFGPINIGSDQDINITEIAEKIITVIGSKSNITYTEDLLFMTLFVYLILVVRVNYSAGYRLLGLMLDWTKQSIICAPTKTLNGSAIIQLIVREYESSLRYPGF